MFDRFLMTMTDDDDDDDDDGGDVRCRVVCVGDVSSWCALRARTLRVSSPMSRGPGRRRDSLRQ